MTKPSANGSPAYPPISDYALLSDCQCTALVSRSGSIDWCCMPRMDADTCFARILDWQQGGFCAITPTGDYRASRWYEDGTLILVSRFETEQGEVRLYDFFTVSNALREPNFYQLVRILEGVAGEVEMEIQVSPRFDFGEIAPYLRRYGEDTYTAWASNMGFVIHFDRPLDVIEKRDLKGRFKIRPGERVHFSLRFDNPEHLQAAAAEPLSFPQRLDRQLDDCRIWWRDWSGQMHPGFARDPYTCSGPQ